MTRVPLAMFDLNRFGHDISRSYHRHIVAQHKEAQLFILASFLVTFTIVRLITHAIRDDRFRRVLHNIQGPGGTHIHHLVPGIILLLISGYLGIGLAPDVPREPIAVIFGVGAALTLDEFALWLHLEDVYWLKQGRQSIDAVTIMLTILALGLLGHGFWLDFARASGRFLGLL